MEKCLVGGKRQNLVGCSRKLYDLTIPFFYNISITIESNIIDQSPQLNIALLGIFDSTYTGKK